MSRGFRSGVGDLDTPLGLPEGRMSTDRLITKWKARKQRQYDESDPPEEFIVDLMEEFIADLESGDPGVAVAPTISAVLPKEASDQAIAQAVRATPQGQVVAVAMADALHTRILNLPCLTLPSELPTGATNILDAYKLGHRDARHAAAEVVAGAVGSPRDAKERP